MSVPLSVLDLATIGPEGTGAALRGCVEVAQAAESHGIERVWYAEHHNMSSIGSSATAVLIAHIAAHTKTIRLGAGGIMLPNHSPLVIAEQFGTLAELHPGRIELGLGRAPGTDGHTFRALRRTHQAAENFPSDVLELQQYLGTDLPKSAVNAYPGRGTNVPLTILGSSMFGASLAASLGLPYGFASHFAPQALKGAVQLYRDRFTPSETLDKPYVIAGVNVVAAETNAEAEALFERVKVERVRMFLSRGRDVELTSQEAEQLMDYPAAREILGMFQHTLVGDDDRVSEKLAEFAAYADADELMTTHPAPTHAERLSSVRVMARGSAERAAA